MLRNKDLHKLQCDYVERKGISASERLHFSSTYGINRRSLLSKSDMFDVTKQLPEDIMHVFLEGICVLHTAILLHHLIFEAELITLDEFNGKLRSYSYLYFEIKPTPLSAQAIKDYDLSGKQSGKYIYITAVILKYFIKLVWHWLLIFFPHQCSAAQ